MIDLLLKHITGLRTRLLLFFLMLLVLPLIWMGLYGHHFNTHTLKQRAVDRSTQEVQLQAEHIVNRLSVVRTDVFYLAGLRTLRRLQETDRNDPEYSLWWNESARDLHVFSLTHPMYSRVRYIDASGQERVRVDGSDEMPQIVPVDDLENRRGTDYFQQTMGISEGDVHITSLGYNEPGSQPIIQYALRLRDDLGIIIVDVYAGWLLRDLLDSNIPDDDWGLADETGSLIVYPAAYLQLQQQNSTDAPLNLGVIYPEAENLLNAESGVVEANGDVIIYTTIFPNGDDRGRYWVIYRATPRSVFYTDLTAFHQTSLFVVLGSVLVTLALAFIASEQTIAPIVKLRHIVEAFGQGGNAPPTPRKIANDEVGALTRSFCDMAQELERKRAEQRLLIERLIDAQEEERKFVAYDLHDGLIQKLVGARLHLSSCRQHCPVDSRGGDAVSLRRGCDVLSEAIVEGRRIIEGLHPTVLDDLGLVPALEEMAGTMAAENAWQLDLRVRQLAVEPEKPISVTIYRIVQEALNNIAKHAGATQVQVVLMNGSGLSLVIADNGCGFDLNNLPQGDKRLGVTTMHERADLLSGTCEITSCPGDGTTIRVWLPWKDKVITS